MNLELEFEFKKVILRFMTVDFVIVLMLVIVLEHMCSLWYFGQETVTKHGELNGYVALAMFRAYAYGWIFSELSHDFLVSVFWIFYVIKRLVFWYSYLSSKKSN